MAKPKQKDQAQKVWTQDEIRANIMAHDAWLYRGLTALYAKQTADEQSAETTKYHNKVGFNGVDAKFMTSLAKFYQRESRLTGRQIASCRKTINKYCGQLSKIANGEI